MSASFRVVTYNINRGLSSLRKSQALEAIVRVMEESGADALCLQEVWRETGIGQDHLQKLTERIWPHYIFNRNAVFPRGIQGNAILSRGRIRSWVNVDVSVRGVEPRGFIDARLELPGCGGEVALFCLHFGLTEKERVYQAGCLIRHLKEKVDPSTALIVAGDFNDWTGKVDRHLGQGSGLAAAVKAETGRHGRTFPAIFPVLSLDRIYYRGLELAEARVLRDAGWKGLSDHSPVYARFLLHDPAGMENSRGTG